jgi:ketosteroid isomerase-like protein
MRRQEMDVLKELLAREQIKQLAVRYAVAADAKDLDTLAALFPDDVNNGRYGTGPDGVKRHFDHVLRRFHCSMHLVANHLIEFDGDDQAHGVVYCRAQHHVLEPEHWWDMALAYWDVYERRADRWYFRRRKVAPWYTQAVGHPSEGTERVVPELTEQGSMRGSRMPDAFGTVEAFWSRPPLAPPDA